MNFHTLTARLLPIMNNKFVQRLGLIKGLKWIRVHWVASLITLGIALPVLFLVRFLTVDPASEYITAPVLRGELMQTVESVGTVISEKDLELKFPVSGIVSEVLVDEGDAVTSGQELARLRSGSLGAAVASALARLTTANAELRALQEGARPEDIAIAEAELRNKQAALALARSKFETATRTLETAESKIAALRRESVTALSGRSCLRHLPCTESFEFKPDGSDQVG